MEKTVIVDGREVKLRATAAVPRLYRIKFKRDIIKDMSELKEAVKKAKTSEGDLPPSALEMFENVAYIMAKHADPTGVPDDPMDWLDQFNTFSIYEVFPAIGELWGDNMQTTSRSKKK